MQDGKIKFNDPLAYALEAVEHMPVEDTHAVPMKPSIDMLTAGASAGEVSVETVWKIYNAMLTATSQ